jgi:hypothetical protein
VGTEPVPDALALGWHIEQLYRSLPKIYQPTPEIPERLRGLRSLQRRQRLQWHLDEVHVGVRNVCDAFVWDSQVSAPSTEQVFACLASLQPKDGAGHGRRRPSPARTRPPSPETEEELAELKAAISTLHEELLIKLMAADARVGTAYNLGRSLADTCRPNQAADDLKETFKVERLAQLNTWLITLATALPDHSAKAVSQSLAWWRDAVYLDVLIVNTSSQIDLVKVMARSTAPGLIARRGLPRSPWNPYGEPRKKKIASTRISKLSGDQAARYTGALERQGEIWRTLLTGEKDACGLLDPPGLRISVIPYTQFGVFEREVSEAA